MKPYKLNTPIGELEPLPPFSESPGYTVLEGNPEASFRLDSGSVKSRHRLGIWRCTPGTFSCTEKGDELQTLLEGRLTLIDEVGDAKEFGPGDSIYTIKGSKMTWSIHETVTKVFFTYDSDGCD